MIRDARAGTGAGSGSGANETEAEIAKLISLLHETGQRLEQLTGGEVDSVTGPDGRTLLLQSAQDGLRVREADRRATILNSLPAQVAMLDHEGNIVTANKSWLQSAPGCTINGCGCAPGVSYLRDCEESSGEGSGDARRAAAGIREVLDRKVSVFTMEYRTTSPASEQWYQLTATPLSQQRTSGAIVMHVDISERVHARESLRAFRQAMDSTLDLILFVNRTSMRIVDANATACRALGYTAEELLQVLPWNLYGVSEAALARRYDETIAGVRPTEFVEMTVMGKNNNACFEVRRSAHRSGNDWIIVGVGRDITERNRAARQLEESERRLTDMLGNVELAAVMLDCDARITFCNEYLLRLTGWRRNEVIGKDWFTTFVPARRHDAKAGFAALLLEMPESAHFESEIVTHSGGERLIHWSNTLLRSSEGAIVGTASIGQDITESARLQKQALTMNAELERRVLDRTAELQAANKELETFDYSVSHDLRAPLSRIDGFGNLLLEQYADKLDEPGRDMLQRIVEAGRTMDRLVGDLFALSTVARGQIEREPVDVSAVAQSIAAGLSTSQPGREVRCDIAPQMRTDADPGLVKVILDNLMANAWKFTGRRAEARIEIGCTGAGPERIFFVRDNGAGFDERNSERLFTPFQRLHSQGDFAGSGIGLATVQRIIRRHGGRIWAQSKVDAGATFFFTLAPPVQAIGMSPPPNP